MARTLSGANWSPNTAKRLDKAGNPPGWDPERILAAKTLAGLGLASLVGGLLFVGGRGLQALLWGAAFGVFGFFLPDLLLINKAQHRSEQIQKALPDSIDLLTISVESGLAFDAALAQVARNTDGPLAEEFTRVLKEIQIGSGRSEALRALSERTDVDDLRIFLNSMIQAEKLGIPIADVLRVQAAEMRLKRSQRIEEQAMKLPGQDHLPADPLHHAGDVHRHPRARGHQHLPTSSVRDHQVGGVVPCDLSPARRTCHPQRTACRSI